MYWVNPPKEEALKPLISVTFLCVKDETDVIGGDVSYQQSSSRNMRAVVGGVQDKMYAQERLRREMELEMEEMHR